MAKQQDVKELLAKLCYLQNEYEKILNRISKPKIFAPKLYDQESNEYARVASCKKYVKLLVFCSRKLLDARIELISTKIESLKSELVG